MLGLSPYSSKLIPERVRGGEDPDPRKMTTIRPLEETLLVVRVLRKLLDL